MIAVDRIRHMLRKEFIQIFRDSRMTRVIFLMPVIQTLVFGYAVTTDVEHVPTAVLDLDASGASRELVGRFDRSGYFDVVVHLADESEVQGLVDRREVAAVLRMNPGFGQELRAGRTASLQVIVDGTDATTAGVVLDYASRIASAFSEKVLATRAARSAGGSVQMASVELETRAWFNENLESRNYYVPGVLAILVMLVTLMLTSMAVVREKEIGTIEQIMVTPISSVEFILGKTVPFALIGFVDVLVVTGVAVGWFEVPIRGSLTLLAAGTALYLLTTLGIGLLISTVSATQQEAMMSAFLFYFPAVLLSGFMFPIANMPEVVQWFTCLNPLRHFLVVVRGVFLKGVGLEILWPQMVALAALGAVTVTAAARRFRKTLA